MISIIVREFCFNEHHSVFHWILEIFKFNADSYSWYINMYIGLYLFIPFLNMILRGLNNAKEHMILILVLIFLTALPKFLNNIVALFPDWWMNIYPITYYFVGAYIKRYKFKINKAFAGILFVLTIALETFIIVRFSKGGQFVAAVGDYGSILIMFSAVLIFLIFYDVDIRNRIIKSAISWISILSLDIYLSSFITDKFVYKYVMESIFVTQHQIIFYAVFIVVTTFTLASMLSLCRYKFTELGKMFFNLMKKPEGVSKDTP